MSRLRLASNAAPHHATTTDAGPVLPRIAGYADMSGTTAFSGVPGTSSQLSAGRSPGVAAARVAAMPPHASRGAHRIIGTNIEALAGGASWNPRCTVSASEL